MPIQLMPQELLRRAAERFRLLAEPVRLELLNHLHVDGELTVSELVARTGYNQANVSKHLLLMAAEGLLRRRKDGLHVYYAIADPTLAGLCVLVCSQVNQPEETASTDLVE